MGKQFSRRNILKIVGGSVAGLVFTPIPWKILDDVSIWTQNWSWMPVPLKGEISFKFSVCTICPAGCAVKARCVGEQPVSLWPVEGHPVNSGALCPLGFAGHHLPYHPARLAEQVRIIRHGKNVSTTAVSIDEIYRQVAGAIQSLRPGEKIAVFDQRPGRTISHLYRRFLAGTNDGIYCSPRPDETIHKMIGRTYGPVGFDVENASTIISFGTPVVEDWGIPGRVVNAIQKRANSDRKLRLIQVETRFSQSASVADRWLPINPGTEAVLALGIAHILVRDGLVDLHSLAAKIKDFDLYKQTIINFTPEKVSEITGLRIDEIRSAAKELVTHTPALAICGSEPAGGPMNEQQQTAIQGLNILLGNVGKEGGLVFRRDLPFPISEAEADAVPESGLNEIPDGTVKVLIIDGTESGNAMPWRVLQKKLSGDSAIVLSLSPYLVGWTKYADYVIPSPTYLESLQDIPVSFDSVKSGYAISAPLVKPQRDTTEPIEVLKGIARAAGLSGAVEGSAKHIEDYMKERVGQIHKEGRGYVYGSRNGRSISVSDIGTSQQMWNQLTAGGYWIDDPAEQPNISGIELLGGSTGFDNLLSGTDSDAGLQQTYPLVLIPFGWRGVVDSGPVSPLLTKLYQESDYRQCTNKALINPQTARTYRLREGRKAVLETKTGRIEVVVIASEEVMPGVVHVALGPDSDSLTGRRKVAIQTSILSVCDLSEDNTWRVTRARTVSAS